MDTLVPNRLLFAFEFALRFRTSAPSIDGDMDDWSEAQRLPSLGRLDDQPDFGDVYACWNETGIFVAARVEGRKKPLSCDPSCFWDGDNLRLCIDTRDARTNKRATRFCHQFYFLPTGGGARGTAAVAGQARIQRARADAPLASSQRLAVAAKVTNAGYQLEGHIPADCLNGFRPGDHSRIGFYYILEDKEHGQQYLTVGDDLYWYVDPSTWATAVLAK